MTDRLVGMMRRRPRLLLGAAAAVLLAACAQQPPDDNADDSADDRPDRRDQPVLVIAHRGASAYAPHDTVAAAREAAQRGADVVEADIRQTRDGHLVALFHASLAPTTDVEQVFPARRPWRVEDFTLREIRSLDAGSWFSARFAGTRVPTLGELAEVVGDAGMRLLVEPKSPGRYPGIGRRITREVRSRPGLYLEIECFDQAFLRGMARRSLPVDLGVTGTPRPHRLAEVARFADAVNPQLSTIDSAYVERAHAHGLDVKVWSLNDRASIRRSVGMDVDGVYSHRPDLVASVLGRR